MADGLRTKERRLKMTTLMEQEKQRISQRLARLDVEYEILTLFLERTLTIPVPSSLTRCAESGAIECLC
jgi:hypothetical protein